MFKNSPTVGLYIFSDDYIRFCKNLKFYISLDLKFISLNESKHKDWIIENGDKNHPIGLLGDVEIIFVHYHNQALAYEKWTKRVKRINWGNLIFKFSQQNHATENDLKEFDETLLPGKKIMFVTSNNHKYKCGVCYKRLENDLQVYNDTFYPYKYFNIYKFINKGILIQR